MIFWICQLKVTQRFPPILLSFNIHKLLYIWNVYIHTLQVNFIGDGQFFWNHSSVVWFPLLKILSFATARISTEK